ncbi:MAG: hypothetical protein V9G98_00350 [Candidatus Competibacter sp.]
MVGRLSIRRFRDSRLSSPSGDQGVGGDLASYFGVRLIFTAYTDKDWIKARIVILKLPSERFL